MAIIDNCRVDNDREIRKFPSVCGDGWGVKIPIGRGDEILFHVDSELQAQFLVDEVKSLGDGGRTTAEKLMTSSAYRAKATADMAKSA